VDAPEFAGEAERVPPKMGNETVFRWIFPESRKNAVVATVSDL
jgi:hypothetical protein